MELPEDSLRLVLIALNELKQIAVLGSAERFGPELRSMGVVKGKEELEAFLNMAGVDHYVVTYGEPFVTTFRSAPFAQAPQQIVAALEKGFREADELRSRLRSGQTVSDEERSRVRFVPRSWLVWSSTVSSEEGMERVRSWFAEKKAGSADSETEPAPARK
jgi:hypothetical protein